ncbi:MAG: hypothetical protein J6N52_12385 [Clostridia bacterium]|nr:hypothetical protein [Clostridia bacterium]
MKSVKRFAVLLVTLICALMAVTAEAREESAVRAEALTGYLLGENKLNGESGNAVVTRGEFTAAITEVFRVFGGTTDIKFNDVPDDHPHSREIYAAANAGLVNAGGEFYPDREITPMEAVKIVIGCTGYGKTAEIYGGWQKGYSRAAAGMGILKGVDTASGVLSPESAKQLIYNALIFVPELDMLDGHETYMASEGRTILYCLYKMEAVSGVVSRTPHCSDSGKDISRDKFIEINGVHYDYEAVSEELFGKKVFGYYIDGSAELCFVVGEDNDELSFDMKDFEELTDSVISWFDNGKTKTRPISRNCVMIYNGRAAEFADGEKIKGDAGSVRILDNNNDGKTDYIFVTSYSYMVVDSLLYDEIIITDINGKAPVTINTENTILSVFSDSGEEMETDDLAKGNVIAAAASDDGSLMRAVCFTQAQTVKISGINLGEKKLFTDKGELEVSDYALASYKYLMTAGAECDVITGFDGEVIYMRSARKGISYGYLMKAWMSDDGDGVKAMAQIFTQDSEIKSFSAEKLWFDGETKATDGESAAAILKSHEGELIRYSADENDVLKNIDLAEVTANPADCYDKPDKNSLTKVELGVTSFIYRSNTKTCSPYFNVDGSIIFKVPQNVDAGEDFYSMCTYSSLSDGGNYGQYFTVYDMNEKGTAGAVVWRYNSDNPSYTSGDLSYVVDEVTYGIDPDGTASKIVTCVNGGEYTDFYIDDKICPAYLSAGDIIRIKHNSRNMITNILLDFDYSPGSGVPAASLEQKAMNDLVGYSFGRAYRASDGYIYLSSQTESGASDYSPSALRNFSINTTNITRVKNDGGKIYINAGSYNEIRDYKNFADKNDFIVIRQRYQSPAAVFIYEARED